jgi:endogenous inhibitor of DNA gyrase (YacG/DUF329 family)
MNGAGGKARSKDAGKANRLSCPICGKPRIDDYRPFCSKRCADVDLGRWLKGHYAIPVTQDSDEDGDKADMTCEAPSADDDQKI